MFKNPLTHLFIILGVLALWYTVTVPKSETMTKSPPRPHKIQTEIQPRPESLTERTEPGQELRTGAVQLDLPSEAVEVTNSQGKTALVHIDMQNHKRLVLDLEFSGPSVDWSFNLGDSNTNNGWGGDSSTAIHDAEIQILNGNLEIYGSDLLDHYPEYPPKKRFMKAWKNVVDDDGGTVRIEIADGEVTYIDSEGRRDSYHHPALFALAGQDDPEAGVNYDLYLGVNRVVAGGRVGSGLSRVQVRLLP